jgi:hypothetical protein
MPKAQVRVEWGVNQAIRAAPPSVSKNSAPNTRDKRFLKHIPLRIQLKITSRTSTKALLELVTNTKIRSSRSGNMIDSGLFPLQRVRRNPYIAIYDQRMMLKAMGQGKKVQSPKVNGMNESPQIRPKITVVLIGRFVIFMSVHLL